MNAFLIYAHAEPKSFNGVLFRTAQDTLEATGHTVQVSDLYGMKFDPVSDRRNFTAMKWNAARSWSARRRARQS